MAKKILPSLFTFLWVLMICVLGLYYIFFAPRGSEYFPDENRTLAGFPDVSFDSVFSGKFGQAFETYLLDRFPARNKVISATNKLQSDLSFASHDEYLMIAEGPNDALDTDIDQSELDDLLSDLGPKPTDPKPTDNPTDPTGDSTEPPSPRKTRPSSKSPPPVFPTIPPMWVFI